MDFYIGAAGVDHETCALSLAGNCEAPIIIDFTQPVSALSFETLGWDAGDFVDFYAGTQGAS